MSILATTPESQAFGLKAKIYDDDLRSHGYVAKHTKDLAVNPEAYVAFEALISAITQNMDVRRYELITLAAAQALGSAHCRLAHGLKALRAIAEDELVQIAKDYHNAGLTPAEVAMMEYAERLSTDAVAMTDVDTLELAGPRLHRPGNPGHHAGCCRQELHEPHAAGHRGGSGCSHQALPAAPQRPAVSPGTVRRGREAPAPRRLTRTLSHFLRPKPERSLTSCGKNPNALSLHAVRTLTLFIRGKYRAHLDLATTSAAHHAELVERLLELGATPADVGQGDVPWTVLADPEGNVFCVLEPRDIYPEPGRSPRWWSTARPARHGPVSERGFEANRTGSDTASQKNAQEVRERRQS